MKHVLTEIEKLPPLAEFRNRLKALAALDAILMEDWEYRFFSFNSQWDIGEEMASARDGEGNEYYFLLSAAGVAGKVFNNEYGNSTYNELRLMPDQFLSFKNEPAFKLDSFSFLIWCSSEDSIWNVVPERDKGIPFLRFLGDSGNYYYEWAQNYYEIDINFDLVKKVFTSSPMDESLARLINPTINYGNLVKDLSEIGYPVSGS